MPFGKDAALYLDTLLGAQPQRLEIGAVLPGMSEYDPEMIYVECRICGRPVLWEPGHTTALLSQAGVDFSTLDERCLLLSEGCPVCRPEEEYGFSIAVVRIAGLTAEESVYMSKPGGNA